MDGGARRSPRPPSASLDRLALRPPSGLDAQKKTPRAAERLRDDVALERWLFEALKPTLDGTRLVFVDESGVDLSLRRRYAWSRRGAPAYGDVPVNRGKNQTLIAAVRLGGGLVASMARTAVRAVEGATTGDGFAAYVRHVLAPALRPGDIVCLDNLSAHKTSAVRAALHEVGAEVLYLPRYSPEHNPVELLWAAVKLRLRSLGVGAAEALDAAIEVALGSVSVADVQGWFVHCGYYA